MLLTYEPDPRKVLWYQSQFAGYAEGVECKASKVKAHPGSAMLHVRLKRSSLCRIFGTSIQKNDHLIFGKKV